MTANKRITDLTDYTSVLPYASELFGVYQPLLGWKSARKQRRLTDTLEADSARRRSELLTAFRLQLSTSFNADHQLQGGVGIGSAAAVAAGGGRGVLVDLIADEVAERGELIEGDRWAEHVNRDRLTDLLDGRLFDTYRDDYTRRWRALDGDGPAIERLKVETIRALGAESATAGLLLALAEGEQWSALAEAIGLRGPAQDLPARLRALDPPEDLFARFDPARVAGEVNVSPVGIVHLFRQYFFELDTFVGTPVGHVWMSPGSTVELIEVSTRRSLVDTTVETELSSSTRSERSSEEKDELSEAVKQNNRDDMKLGFSTTVNQSWPAGDASATGSLDLTKTQETGRDRAHTRMRTQSEKLSTEIRQSYKSTFRTVSESVDTSSKRYVLTNPGPDLVNYEMRRKMRQVGVQIQDAGAYLCWETFVDEPGRQLGLPDLVHIARPADLVTVPNPRLVPTPPDRLSVPFSGQAVWNFPSNERQYAANHPEVRGRFVPIATLDIVGVPADYEVVVDPANPFVEVSKQVVAAEDDDSWNAANWAFGAMITTDGKRLLVGVGTAPSGLSWDDRITFTVSGSVPVQLSPAKRAEISAANDALVAEKMAADAENTRRLEEAYVKAAADRITAASKVRKRPFDDLREEERTIVYRNLMRSLLTAKQYDDTAESAAALQARHALSEVINSLFDVDKMLYFVAPEWWKPRPAAQLQANGVAVATTVGGSTVRWDDGRPHPRYPITSDAEPAPLGSSLGWVLQLDGDRLRNAFLNAPWVKAVIPIRPGQEQAAMAWLTNAGVEGADGLGAAYHASDDDLAALRARLLARDPADEVAGHADPTIGDALRDLCHRVTDEHTASRTVGRYPDDEVDDANRVSATPLERVFEHGFYPLQGGFKARAETPFEICSQWIEVLPTDQVVPVPVAYDPRTGRQLPPV